MYGSTISFATIAFVYATNGPGLFGHVRHAVDRERDVLGGELAAVVELDALAQLELPGLVVDRLPRRREPGNHLRVRVHLHELVEDVLGDVVVGKEVEEVRIDRRDVGGDRDLQLLRARRGGEGERHATATAAPVAQADGAGDMGIAQETSLPRKARDGVNLAYGRSASKERRKRRSPLI